MEKLSPQILGMLKQIADNVKGVPPEMQIIFAIINILFALISTFALIWTLIKLIENTKLANKNTEITNGLLNYAKKQHITSIRPYLRLQKQKPLILVNEGRGVAINIELIYVNGKVKKNFNSVPAMASAPGSSTVVKDFIDGSTNTILNPETNHFAVEAKYEDIEGNKYKAEFMADYSFNDRFRIVSQKSIK